IRLRGPWKCEPMARLSRIPNGQVISDSTNLPPPFTATIPNRWQDAGLPDFAGRVCFKRNFGYPGRIDATERVWLALDRVVGSCSLFLNAQALASSPSPPDHWEFEVTDLLRRRNELVITLEDLEGQGGLTGEVAIEVRLTAFLKDVKAERLGADQIEITGQV